MPYLPFMLAVLACSTGLHFLFGAPPHELPIRLVFMAIFGSVVWGALSYLRGREP